MDNLDVDLLSLGKGARVIDVGCGEGDTTIRLGELGYRTVGVEVNEDLVRNARRIPSRRSAPMCVADGLALPFSDGSFDAALLIEVIEHTPATEELLREVRRVLRSGGRVCIAWPTSYTERIYWRLHPGYARNAGHVKIIELPEMMRTLKECGFRTLDVRARNFTPALSWLLHSLLLSRSTDTGRILQDRWVDTLLNAAVGAWRHTPLLNRALAWASERFGKSWYLYCEKPA